MEDPKNPIFFCARFPPFSWLVAVRLPSLFHVTDHIHGAKKCTTVHVHVSRFTPDQVCSQMIQSSSAVHTCSSCTVNVNGFEHVQLIVSQQLRIFSYQLRSIKLNNNNKLTLCSGVLMNYGRALQDIVLLRSPKRQVNTGGKKGITRNIRICNHIIAMQGIIFLVSHRNLLCIFAWLLYKISFV